MMKNKEKTNVGKFDGKEILNFIKNLAINAGQAIIKIYNSNDFEIQIKKDNFPLTKADLLANQIIVSNLKSKFPNFGILTEEEEDNKERLSKEYVWIIDPIDGTKEFINRNGEFTVNIGLVKSGEPILGVIYVPTKGELFYAFKDIGTFYETVNSKVQIKVSNRMEINNMILVKSRSHTGDKLIQLINKYCFAEIKTSGSSIKGCLISKGDSDVYFRFGPTHEWDICAMHAIIKSAGGEITDLKGEQIHYNKSNTLINGFIVSNNKIHRKFVEMVKNG